MPDSQRLLFLTGAGGYLTPTLLRWSTQERITLPGDTWWITAGWAVSTIFFATLAGLFVLHVWKERTARRAFMVGLALPYILSGFVADAASVAKVRRAGAQTETAQSGEKPNGRVFKQELSDAVNLNETLTWGAVPFKVNVVGAGSGKPLADVRTRIYPQGGGAIPVAASAAGTYALPPGKYRVFATATGYNGRAVDVDLKEPRAEPITVELEKASWFQQFWAGAKSAVLPERLPMTLP
jgi:hypothetical protein